VIGSTSPHFASRPVRPSASARRTKPGAASNLKAWPQGTRRIAGKPPSLRRPSAKPAPGVRLSRSSGGIGSGCSSSSKCASKELLTGGESVSDAQVIIQTVLAAGFVEAEATQDAARLKADEQWLEEVAAVLVLGAVVAAPLLVTWYPTQTLAIFNWIERTFGYRPGAEAAAPPPEAPETTPPRPSVPRLPGECHWRRACSRVDHGTQSDGTCRALRAHGWGRGHLAQRSTIPRGEGAVSRMGAGLGPSPAEGKPAGCSAPLQSTQVA